MRILSSLLVASLLVPLPVSAQDDATCREAINRELGLEQRLYRAHLFGKPRAVDATIGSVRYDNEGIAWLKQDTSDTPWVTADEENRGLQWSNTVMDNQDEHRSFLPIKGMFATRRVTTTELIPYALQSIRALECRIEVLCDRVSQSTVQSGEDPVIIPSSQPYGCVEFTNVTTFPACHFAHPDDSTPKQVDSLTYCNSMREQLLQRESELLKLTIEYDAGYRSLLQLAGNVDIFLRELRWPLTTTLRQAVQLIGQLQRIPCFISSCDASP